MMIAVPLSMLGIDNYQMINVEFKWADSEGYYDEMEDFYCDGDVAPLGSLNYVYQNYIPGVSIFETDAETEAETVTKESETFREEPTEVSTEDASQTSEESETGAEKGSGCKSAVGMLMIPMTIAFASFSVICRKRKEK